MTPEKLIEEFRKQIISLKKQKEELKVQEERLKVNERELLFYELGRIIRQVTEPFHILGVTAGVRIETSTMHFPYVYHEQISRYFKKHKKTKGVEIVFLLKDKVLYYRTITSIVEFTIPADFIYRVFEDIIMHGLNEMIVKATHLETE